MSTLKYTINTSGYPTTQKGGTVPPATLVFFFFTQLSTDLSAQGSSKYKQTRARTSEHHPTRGQRACVGKKVSLQHYKTKCCFVVYDKVHTIKLPQNSSLFPLIPMERTIILEFSTLVATVLETWWRTHADTYPVGHNSFQVCARYCPLHSGVRTLQTIRINMKKPTMSLSSVRSNRACVDVDAGCGTRAVSLECWISWFSCECPTGRALVSSVLLKELQTCLQTPFTMAKMRIHWRNRPRLYNNAQKLPRRYIRLQ